MNKKEKGKKLEEIILDRIKENDSKARLSRASGASNDIGDITCERFYIEAKNWNKHNVIMQIKDWEHLVNQMPINTQKIPIYVFQNNQNKRWAILDFNDFIELIKEG